MALDLNDLRNRIGKDKYDEISKLAQELKKQGKNPNEIAEHVMAKYPEEIKPMISFVLSPIIFVLLTKSPP